MRKQERQIMCRCLRMVMIVASLTSFASVANAEVLELEGTIKAIDAEARSVTIVRKTPKGEKELELEVAKNAGDLAGLKAGDRVSFAYNPDVDIISKIEKGLSEEAAATLKELEGVWMAVKVDRHGTMMTPKELREQSRRIIIDGNTFRQEETREGRTSALEGKFSINPATGAFDFEGVGPRGNPLKLIGLYEVKGDTLRLCFRANVDGRAKRPTEFKADADSPNYSLSYTCKKLPID